MKIVYFIRSLGTGGAERQLITLANALSKFPQYTVTVMVFYSDGALEKHLSSSNIELISLNKRGRWDVVGFCYRLLSELRRIKPNILHTFLDTANILGVFLKLITPKLKLVWSIRSAYVDWSKYDRLARLTYNGCKRLSRFPNLIVYNSDTGRHYHQTQGFSAKNGHIIHNGVDIQRFKPNLQRRTEMRREFGIPNDVQLITLVGRIDPMKDHYTFLKAAKLALAQNSNLRFLCLGMGPADYCAELMTFAKQQKLADAIVWRDEYHDMPLVYAGSDIVTLCSIGEAFPNVIGEAMACGVSCVATDVGDIKSIIGTTGLLVEPARPSQLADAWQDALKKRNKLDKREINSHQQMLYSRIRKHFSVETLLEKTKEVYSKL